MSLKNTATREVNNFSKRCKMTKINNKIIAASVISSILFASGMAFAAPQPAPVAVPMNGQMYAGPNDAQPHHIYKKPVKHQRYVYVRKKNGKVVKVDCWKKQNKHQRVCYAR